MTRRNGSWRWGNDHSPRKLLTSLLTGGLFLVILAALVALYIALYKTLPMTQASVLINGARIFLIMISGLLPAVIYTSWAQGRLPNLFTEYKQSLRRLGYPENAQLYNDKFDAVFGRKAKSGRLPQIDLHIVIATLLAFVGWILVFFPPVGAPEGLVPNPTPLAYGFLGAYIFGLGSLVRQYVIDDLQLRYYASLINRYLTVFVLSGLVTLLVQVGGSGSSPSLDGAYLLAAFVIGLFPSSGLRVVQRLGTAALGMGIKGLEEAQPLGRLDGFNAYHADRLQLEGIENMQNMSCAKIVDLMVKTRYPVEQIIDWIDQALLHLHAPDWITVFKSNGLRTATDFLDAYGVPGLPPDVLTTRRDDLAALLNSQHPEGASGDLAHTRALLDAMAAALRHDPNLFHVLHWRQHEYEALPEDVERARTAADLKLMQGLPDEAIAAYDELLQTFPEDYSARLYRGLAYFAMGEYSRAIDDYTQVIELGGESARQGYVERGRALREMGEYAEAAKNYQEALETYAAFPEAHLELAYVQMAYLGQYDEAIGHLQTVVAAGFREAEAQANLGLVRYVRWVQQGRSAQTRDAELGQAKIDLERALRLKPDLVDAQLNLASVLEGMGQEDEATEILTGVLQKPETTRDPESAYRARLHRGNLYLQQEDYEAAADDYRVAIELAPDNAAAFFNLGIVLQELRQFDAAAQAFRRTIRLNPRHLPAHQELGNAVVEQALLDDAEMAYSTALLLAREAGDRGGQALAHLSLGRLYRRRLGRQTDARRELQQAIELAEDLVYTQASHELGLLELAEGGLEKAVTLFRTSAELFDVLGDVRASVRANLALGRAYLALQDSAGAAQALEKARQQLGRVFEPLNADDAQLQRDIDVEVARCEPGQA